VLEIAVERDCGCPACRLEACEESRLMSEVAAEADQADRGILGAQLADTLSGAVRGAVIDEDDFQILRSSKGPLDAIVNPTDIGLLVESWED
jgi:hypothetical protein